jgi:hypothetical protein
MQKLIADMKAERSALHEAIELISESLSQI